VVISHDKALNECRTRHAVEQLERTEVEAGRLQAIGDDCLYGSQDGAEKRHREAVDSRVIVSVGG